MESANREREGDELVNAGETSFLELLCEADPSIQIQALRGGLIKSAYRPDLISCSLSLTKRAPTTELARSGEDSRNEYLRGGGASSILKFSEAERIIAGGAEKIKLKRKRASRTCQCKFLLGCKCREIKSKKKLKKDASWFNVNLKKDNLEVRIAELYELINGSRRTMPSIASVFQETKESIVSSLHELKVLTSFYMQRSETSSRLLSRADKWTDGLTSRGLCLVPTSTVVDSPLMHKRWTRR